METVPKRNAFDALGTVMGEISIEQANKMGLLDPTSLKDRGSS
jgi:hypothetical protein